MHRLTASAFCLLFVVASHGGSGEPQTQKCTNPKTCTLTGPQAYNEAVKIFAAYQKKAGQTANFDDRSGVTAAAELHGRAEAAHPDRGKPPPNSAAAKRAGWGDVSWLRVVKALLEVHEHALGHDRQVLHWAKKLIAHGYCDHTAQTQALVEREYCWSGIFRNGILAARQLGLEGESKALFKAATSVTLNGAKVALVAARASNAKPEYRGGRSSPGRTSSSCPRSGSPGSKPSRGGPPRSSPSPRHWRRSTQACGASLRQA